jgi:hypothetical protein
MEPIQCPACRVRFSRRPGVVACPGCGARLKGKPKADRDDEDAGGPVRKKKRRKKTRSGPNYALFAVVGGGMLFVGLIAWIVVLAIQGSRKPSSDNNDSTGPTAAVGPNGAAGQAQPIIDAGIVWEAKADPPKGADRLKDDLSIPIQGEPLFASGQAPFVADLVPVIVGTDNPPVLSVYDLRTGERTLTTKAIQNAQTAHGPDPGGGFQVVLGPDGKTLAARMTTSTGTGRQRSTVNEALIYRLGQDAPVARFTIANPASWMSFGRDEDQLIVASATANGGFFAVAHNLKQPAQASMPLQIPYTPNRWRNGFHHPDALAISPGRSYLAVGEGRAIDLIRLADGKPVGRFNLPGDCMSVAFSADGKELTAHSTIAPQRGASGVPPQFQWTTFSMADGKQLTTTQVTGGPIAGSLLSAGPKPGLAVHAERDHVIVADTRVGAPAYSIKFHATQCFDGDRLLGFDAPAKKIVVRRIDAEKLAAGEKVIADAFGPRPDPIAADRAGLAAPAAPAGWNVPIDAMAGDPPALAQRHTVAGGADFVMPWVGQSSLSALAVRRVETPRDRYPLQWIRVDMTADRKEPPIELWPSLLPPGQVPVTGFGSILADHTADGYRVAVRDAATPARVDVWDRSGKRLVGFLPYGPDVQVEALIWTADNRLITRGGGKTTGWDIPTAKALFELTGYTGEHVLSPGRNWIALQYERNIDVFDTTTGNALGRLEQANVAGKPWQSFAVSRNGLQLAAVELVRGGQGPGPCIWGVITWDLKTGRHQEPWRLFGGTNERTTSHLMWLGPRLLLAGGTDVIDLDAKAVTAALGLTPPNPIASPDGRYWGARSDHAAASANQRLPMETIIATSLDDTIRSLPRLAPADIVLREGMNIEIVSQTGDNGRDALARSLYTQVLSAEGYGTGRSDWRLAISGQRTATTATLETPAGKKISIPSISGKARLLDPAGTVVWEVPASGGFDLNHSKYRTSRETPMGPMGGSITHFNFGFRDPGDAMAEEAWDNFMEGLKGTARFPRVLARVNGKVAPLPIPVAVAGK